MLGLVAHEVKEDDVEPLPAQASATKKIDKGLILKALGEKAGQTV